MKLTLCSLHWVKIYDYSRYIEKQGYRVKINALKGNRHQVRRDLMSR